ncbi:type 1 glutamine amidotransferase domain-containing protein [bacterium]|nr:type 1 glutamine amidotransferase domain-containing protein [bacterium]
MNIINKLALAGLAFSTMGMAQASKGKILVVVSSEDQLPLKSGATYPTGFYLNEFGVPAKKLVEEGYELVVANPKGNPATMDARSAKVSYFNGNQAEFESVQKFVADLPQLKKPLSLAQVLRGGLKDYKAIFLPGGHAPMTDLMRSMELGLILKKFHKAGKPTALICHAPVALASAVRNPILYQRLLEQNDTARAAKEVGNWPYAGYQMTVFSTAEEKLAEKSIGGEPLYYPETVLSTAGGKVSVGAEWKANAVRDRELITGQNPFSDGDFVKLLLEALAE